MANVAKLEISSVHLFKNTLREASDVTLQLPTLRNAPRADICEVATSHDNSALIVPRKGLRLCRWAWLASPCWISSANLI